MNNLYSDLKKNLIYFNNMIEQVFKKPNKNGTEKYKYFSVPFFDVYFPKRKSVIKNYVLEVDEKHIG